MEVDDSTVAKIPTNVMSVQCPDVREQAREVECLATDATGRTAHRSDDGSDVVHRQLYASRTRAKVSIQHNDANRVHIGQSSRWVIVEIGMRRAERQDARGQSQRTAFAVTPVDDHRMGVETVEVGEGPVDGGSVILADRRTYS